MPQSIFGRRRGRLTVQKGGAKFPLIRYVWKRAREQVTQAEEKLAHAEDAELACRKAKKQAEAAVEAAEHIEDNKFKVYSRMVKKLTELSHGCAKSSKTLARFHTVSNLVRKSENEHRVARLASKDATIRWLWALADERDAQLDVAQLCLDAAYAD